MKKFFSPAIALILFVTANAQKVGIGNTSPLMKLHVSGLTDTALLLIDNNATLANNVSTGMYFKNGTWYTGSIKTIGMGGDVARLSFHTYSSDGTTAGLVERLSIADGGSVGIGNINPVNAGLVVDTKVGATNAMFGANTTGVAIESSYPGVAFNTYYNGTRKFISAGYGALLGLNPTNGSLTIYNTAASGTAGATAAIAERMRIEPNGDVIVGGSSSFGRFTINGDNSTTGSGVSIYTNNGTTTAARIENFNTSSATNAILAYSQNGTAITASALGTVPAVSISNSTGLALRVTGNTTITGNLTVTGTLSKSAGTFKIDHPLDPANKYLIHSFVESPDMLNVYNGNVVTDKNGMATIELPSYFDAENIDFKYQLTVMGKLFAQAIIYEEVKNNTFVIKTNEPGVKVSWQVTGVRNDAYAKKYRIKAEEEKTGDAKGKYLSPELF
jgi:hypothetical protein